MRSKNNEKVKSQAKAPETNQQPRGRRGRRKNAAGKENGPPQPVAASTVNKDSLNFASHSPSETAIGPGWRNTPIIESKLRPEPNSVELRNAAESRPQFLAPDTRNGKSGKGNRRKKQYEREEQSGWATEEATDIQDMGEFDFEENHKRFDKKKIFEQIRQEDTTADDARLVSFNRLPARLGTNGGKNLHYTENVLDSPIQNATYSSDSDPGAEEAKNGASRIIRRTSLSSIT